MSVYLRRLALLAMMTTIGSVAAAAPAQFVERTVRVDGHDYRYQVFVPAHWTAKHEWPVVLFLHGSGERGDDNQAQLSQGLPPWLRDHGQDFPAVVVIPQAPKDTLWRGPIETMALQALRDSVRQFHGDTHRLYLTGLSMGGYGAWEIAIHHPSQFAAAAVICGGILPPPDFSTALIDGLPQGRDPYAWAADRVGHMPVWIFHGGADPVVPPEGSRRMHQALEKRGDAVRYTEFPGVGHASWIPAYDTAALWPWMFSQRLVESTFDPGEPTNDN